MGGRLVVLAIAALLPATAAAGAPPTDALPHADRAALAVARSLPALAPAQAFEAVAGLAGLDVAGARASREGDAVGVLRAAVARAESMRAAALARIDVGFARSALRAGRVEDVVGLEARVDREGLARAAWLLLDAVALVADGSAPLPAADVASDCGVVGDVLYESDGCDVVVGGRGANVYPAGFDPAIIVDAGGDDHYLNGAASADSDVAMLVDLAGNDVYESRHVRSADASESFSGAQGAALLGVGLLADLQGDDVYVATLTAERAQPGPAAGSVSLFAQGAGALGAAILLDAGGTDTFEARATTSGGGARVAAQGHGDIGVGAVLALGGGDSRFVSSSLSGRHATQAKPYEIAVTGRALAYGQGTGFAGTGMMADAGGADLRVVTASGAFAGTVAQGSGELGAGVLLDAAGDDETIARAEGRVATSYVPAARTVCWDLEAVATSNPSQIVAQGAGWGGDGLLVDAGGNDIRRASAGSFAHAVARAVSTRTCAANEAIARAEPGGANAYAQGAGFAGHGTLVDGAGNDTNRADVESEAVAEAHAQSPGADDDDARPVGGPVFLLAQGAADFGAASITDLGGNDAYRTSSFERTVARDGAGERIASVPGEQEVQGSSTPGLGWLTDIGGTDLYESSNDETRGADQSCWTNGGNGRGRDVGGPTAVPEDCP